MATEYGDDTEPGTITAESSAESIVTSTEAPSDICIIGPADLGNATNPATEDQVYEVRRDSTAIDLFGPQSSSLLTTALIDQIREGASPIYAVAPTSSNVDAEDHSSVSETTVSLANSPCSEKYTDTHVTLDGTTLTVNVTREDVSTLSPEAGECYFNPVEGRVEVPTAPSAGTGMTVDYTHFNYDSALTSIEGNQEAKEEIDFLMPIQETQAVQESVVSTAKTLSADQYYMMAFIAPNAARIDPSSFTNPYDSSRVQTIYPTRFADGSSALAAYAGKRADLGLERTAIRQRLETEKELAVTLDRADRGTLIDKNIVPLGNSSRGAVIRDDPTTLQTDSGESTINYGFKRMALDYVYAVTEENEQPFIGRLHKQAVRNALADLISDQMTAMRKSDIIEAYNVRIFEESATRARLELDIDAPEPLRFIKNDVRIGSFD